MSEGPIKAWRDSWKPPPSTPKTTATHASGAPGRAYCGRKTTRIASGHDPVVTCTDCLAALRADTT